MKAQLEEKNGAAAPEPAIQAKAATTAAAEAPQADA